MKSSKLLKYTIMKHLKLFEKSTQKAFLTNIKRLNDINKVEDFILINNIKYKFLSSDKFEKVYDNINLQILNNIKPGYIISDFPDKLIINNNSYKKYYLMYKYTGSIADITFSIFPLEDEYYLISIVPEYSSTHSTNIYLENSFYLVDNDINLISDIINDSMQSVMCLTSGTYTINDLIDLFIKKEKNK